MNAPPNLRPSKQGPGALRRSSGDRGDSQPGIILKERSGELVPRGEVLILGDPHAEGSAYDHLDPLPSPWKSQRGPLSPNVPSPTLQCPVLFRNWDEEMGWGLACSFVRQEHIC